MSTKTEERIKQLLEDYLESKQKIHKKEISDHIYSIFLWGVIFGTLISYMSVMPLFFGGMMGYILSKKQWLIMDRWIDGWYDWIKNGQTYWLKFWKYEEKKL
jgi:hypothetical protein